MMIKGIASVLVFLTVCCWIISCGNASETKDGTEVIKGNINISVDETFKPVLEEQIKVYESQYPESRIIATYKSEADCFRDLQQDSVRMVIVTRALNKTETQFFQNRLGFTPASALLAFDAVAVIVNKSANDTLFTLEQLSSYLKGVNTTKQIIVDGNNATSTVRYLMDSLLRGASFGSNVVAAKDSRDVIENVALDVNSIGFVGVSWIFGRENTDQAKSLQQVKTALVECRNCEEGTFARPSQATITAAQYPFYRGLYYILKENFTSVGSNFAGFMRYERGQLIFRRAQLVPAKMTFQNRLTDIGEE